MVLANSPCLMFYFFNPMTYVAKPMVKSKFTRAKNQIHLLVPPDLAYGTSFTGSSKVIVCKAYGVSGGREKD